MVQVAAIVFLALLSQTASSQGVDSTESITRNAFSFVSDVTIPDGTLMKPGESFTKTWRIRNVGASSWNGYSLVFDGGEQMGAPPFVLVPVTPPGATVDISVPMTAPKDAGEYQGNWEMSTAEGQFFGDGLFILIRVESSNVSSSCTTSTYEGRTFEAWVSDLQSQSPDIRKKALKALTCFGPRATPALNKVFQSDPDEKVRAMALAAMASVKPASHEVVRIILEAVTDSDSPISMMAKLAVAEVLPRTIGSETVPVLIEVLHDDNTFQRQLAISLLARLGPVAKDAAPTLHEIADHDPEPEVRSMAKEALKQIELGGVVSGNKYDSPRNWFSVQVPKSSNWANVPFTIWDESVNEPGGRNYDLVTFGVVSFGEVLIASVRRIPDEVLEKMKLDKERKVLSSLADKALFDWRDFPSKPKVVDEAYLKTSNGESLLRVYKAENASLLALVGISGGGPAASDEALIAVIVSKLKNHYAYAIAEHDAEFLRGGNKEKLMQRVQSFFSSVNVHAK